MRYFKRAILIASAALCFNLSAFSQDITLKANNVTVKEAMEQLKKSSGYSFVFSSADVNTKKRISISVEDAGIEEVIKQILQGQSGFSYEIQGKKIIIKKAQTGTASSAQEGKVRGRIVDATGEPVIGATVREQGTSNGTTTDIDGNFSLQASLNSTIVISYIGYVTQEIPVNHVKGTIRLKEDTQTLDEVVVVGFGTQKKVNLTGSVATASAKDLEARPVSSAVQALQGVIPGLNISNSGHGGELNASKSINIRGNGTVGKDANNNDYASGSPLILIDGMEGDLNTIVQAESERLC